MKRRPAFIATVTSLAFCHICAAAPKSPVELKDSADLPEVLVERYRAIDQYRAVWVADWEGADVGFKGSIETAFDRTGNRYLFKSVTLNPAEAEEEPAVQQVMLVVADGANVHLGLYGSNGEVVGPSRSSFPTTCLCCRRHIRSSR